MLKLLCLLSAVIFSLANAEEPKSNNWAELIANGEARLSKTTLNFNASYTKTRAAEEKADEEKRKAALAKNPKAQVFEPAEEIKVSSTKEITSLEELSSYRLFQFYEKQVDPYQKAAVEKIGKLSPSQALETKEYQEFRQFVIYGQFNPQLKDLTIDKLFDDKGSDRKLLATLLADPNPEIREGTSTAFWRILSVRATEPEIFYQTIKFFAEHANKDALIESINNVDGKGFLSFEQRICSPQYWTAVRLLAGKESPEAKKAFARLDKKLQELTNIDGNPDGHDTAENKKRIYNSVAARVVVENPDHRHTFITNTNKELEQKYADLERREAEYKNRASRDLDTEKKMEAERRELDKETDRVSDALLEPQRVNEDIQNCSLSKKIQEMSDEDLKKLGSDANFQKSFWMNNSIARSKNVDPQDALQLPHLDVGELDEAEEEIKTAIETEDKSMKNKNPTRDQAIRNKVLLEKIENIEADERKWLQQSIHFLVNRKHQASGTAGAKTQE